MITLAQRTILECQASRAMSEGYVTILGICCLGMGRTQWLSMGTFQNSTLVEEGGLRGKVFQK